MIKTKNNHEELTYLNSYISKVLKRNFGKGPATCFTTHTNDKMFIYIKHFITPAEGVLIKNKEDHLAHKTRSVILKTIFDELKD
ncbi:MAG: Na-translocating system protein MpsC family protein [Bacillota bacterium]